MPYLYTDDELAGLCRTIKEAAEVCRRIQYRYTHRAVPSVSKSVEDFKRRKKLSKAYPAEFFRFSAGDTMLYIDRRKDAYYVTSYGWMPDESLLYQWRDWYPDVPCRLFPRKKPGDVAFFDFGPFAEWAPAERAWLSVCRDFLFGLENEV